MTTGRHLGASHEFLHAGRAYTVIQEFTDYDRQVHPAGERWTFLGSSFVPYDDGMSFYVSIDGKERQMRLQWRPEEQGEVLDRLSEYIRPL